LRYTDEELEAFLDDIESDLTERKETWKGEAPDTGRQAVCAFANDLPDHRKPGILFVGARDNGTPSGLAITSELLLTLSDIKTDGNTLPPPSILVEKRTLKGAELAVVTVRPSETPPVRYKGRIWIRVGPRRAVATPQEDRILNEKAPVSRHPVRCAAVAFLQSVGS
jgi:ATP-dependent DNA helicase RecG